MSENSDCVDDSSPSYEPEDEETATARRDSFLVDPDVVDRGLRGHAPTQNQLASYLISLGLNPVAWIEPNKPECDVADGLRSVSRSWTILGV